MSDVLTSEQFDNLTAAIKEKSVIKAVYCIEQPYYVIDLVSRMFTRDTQAFGILFSIPPIYSYTLKQLWTAFRDATLQAITHAGVWLEMSDGTFAYWDGKL